VVKVRASPQKKLDFHDRCVEIGLQPLNLILDVKTRWNSTFEMLTRAVQLRTVS
jgi:hypothetical protein